MNLVKQPTRTACVSGLIIGAVNSNAGVFDFKVMADDGADANYFGEKGFTVCGLMRVARASFLWRDTSTSQQLFQALALLK